MGNGTDIKQTTRRTSPYWNMVQAMATDGLSNIQISQKIAKQGGALSRERVRIMRQKLGIEPFHKYPRIEKCRSHRGNTHHFMSMASGEHYCPNHRLRVSTCAACENPYSTKGGSVLCRSCGNGARAEAAILARKQKMVTVAKKWLVERVQYDGD